MVVYQVEQWFLAANRGVTIVYVGEDVEVKGFLVYPVANARALVVLFELCQNFFELPLFVFVVGEYILHVSVTLSNSGWTIRISERIQRSGLACPLQQSAC